MAVGNSLKVDNPSFHRAFQYSGGEKSLLNTKGTPLNLACGKLYGGCPLCAALGLSVMAINSQDPPIDAYTCHRNAGRIAPTSDTRTIVLLGSARITGLRQTWG
jgi:hypothetical protein